jgi:hypothetical protein
MYLIFWATVSSVPESILKYVDTCDKTILDIIANHPRFPRESPQSLLTSIATNEDILVNNRPVSPMWQEPSSCVMEDLKMKEQKRGRTKKTNNNNNKRRQKNIVTHDTMTNN